MDRKILFVNFHFLNSFEENFPLFLGFLHVYFCFVFIPVFVLFCFPKSLLFKTLEIKRF